MPHHGRVGHSAVCRKGVGGHVLAIACLRDSVEKSLPFAQCLVRLPQTFSKGISVRFEFGEIFEVAQIR